MEAIRKMEPAWVKVNGRNFALVEYKDAKGELRPITRFQARCDTMFISRKSILTKMTMTTLTTARHAVTRVVTQRCCVRKGTLEQILSHYSNLQ